MLLWRSNNAISGKQHPIVAEVGAAFPPLHYGQKIFDGSLVLPEHCSEEQARKQISALKRVFTLRFSVVSEIDLNQVHGSVLAPQ